MVATSELARFAKNFIPLPGFRVPTVGQLAPELALPQVSGELVRLSDYRGKRPVVLAFTRILNERLFCPFCYPHIQELKERYRDILDTGAELLMISSTELQQSKQIVSDMQLPYPFLSDPDCRMFRAYGAGQALGVPLPAQYIVDRSGRISFRHLFSFTDTNASPDIILAELSRLEAR